MAGSNTKSRDNAGHANSAARDSVLQFNSLLGALRVCALTTSGLAIKASSSVLAKSATAFYYLTRPIGNLVGPLVLGTVAANTDTAAFAGTVTNAKHNVFVHSVSDDGSGTQVKHTRMGTEAAALSGVVLPDIPEGEVIYGMTLIAPSGTGNFVGGTTPLDDATVAPNAVFLSIVGNPAPFSAASKVTNEQGVALT